MGMFDYVKITDYRAFSRKDRKLLKTLDGFQTKDFECMMWNIEIRGRRVYWSQEEYETVPKEERPYPDGEGLLGFCGMLRKVNTTWYRQKGNKIFVFYTSDREDKYWYEWEVLVVNGKIKKVKNVSHPISS